MKMTTTANRMEAAKRRKFVRQKFRKIVKKVLLNRLWLVDLEKMRVSMNHQKNIYFLTQPKRKIGMLTLSEKGLLLKDHRSRSIRERKKLVNIISGLACFANIPPKLRVRLIPVIKFVVLEPGRTIIREGDQPAIVYFILTGEIEISKKVRDNVSGEYVKSVVGVIGPGDCFGEIEILERTSRMNTYRSSALSEMLVIFADEFEDILGAFMRKQWNDKKTVFEMLQYFDFMTDEQRLEALKRAQLQQFEPLESIYCKDVGDLSSVYFVISGECLILQCLRMKVFETKCSKKWELLEILTDNEKVPSRANLKKSHSVAKEKLRFSFRHSSSDDTESANESDLDFSRDLHPVDIQCDAWLTKMNIVKSDKNLQATTWNPDGLEDVESYMKVYNSNYGRFEEYGGIYLDAQTSEVDRNIANRNLRSERSLRTETFASTETMKSNPLSVRETYFKYASSHASKSVEANTPFGSFSAKKKSYGGATLETHFIDVGTLLSGGIFGIGEKMEDRVIMARTTVQCIVLPRFWLFRKDQNPGNVWHRKREYINMTIPSREALFRDFLKMRDWHSFKSKVISDTVKSTAQYNPTKVQDVPIMCRMLEAHDE